MNDEERLQMKREPLRRNCLTGTKRLQVEEIGLGFPVVGGNADIDKVAV